MAATPTPANPAPPRTWHIHAFPQVHPQKSKKNPAQKDLPVDALRTGEAPPLGSAKDPPSMHRAPGGTAVTLKKTRVE